MNASLNSFLLEGLIVNMSFTTECFKGEVLNERGCFPFIVPSDKPLYKGLKNNDSLYEGRGVRVVGYITTYSGVFNLIPEHIEIKPVKRAT